MPKKTTEKAHVYVSCGCTQADFEAAADDPRSLVEGGLSEFAAPQLIGVFTNIFDALSQSAKALEAEVRESIDDDGEDYLPGQHPLDKAYWTDAKGQRADFRMMDVHQQTLAEFMGIKPKSRDWKDLVKQGTDPNKPYGRPTVEAYLSDSVKDEDSWACIIIQRVPLDELP